MRSPAVSLPALTMRRRKQPRRLGVAVFPDFGDTSEAVLKTADDALYRAKKKGRNRVELPTGTDAPEEPAPSRATTIEAAPPVPLVDAA